MDVEDDGDLAKHLQLIIGRHVVLITGLEVVLLLLIQHSDDSLHLARIGDMPFTRVFSRSRAILLLGEKLGLSQVIDDTLAAPEVYEFFSLLLPKRDGKLFAFADVRALLLLFLFLLTKRDHFRNY